MTTASSYTPEPRVPERSAPRILVVLLLLAILIGSVSAAASFIAAVAAKSGAASQEDLLENQRILRTICEQIRSVAESTGSVPPPCPTEAP